MIILKHLTVERFRLLRAMNVHFPQRGSILIQGPNEAGKSALVESIYFALYGEPLAVKRGRRALDDLILYGSDTANVSLVISVGATELTITRTIERGQGQHISLLIRHLGIPEIETLTDLTEANARIINEMGGIDGETLRNTCLVEQKGLTRLETISSTEREATVRKLLDLETIKELAGQFQVRPEDEDKLEESRERLELATIQARIPQLSSQLEQIEIALDAVRVDEFLSDIDQQEIELNELEETLEQIHSQRLDLKSAQGRIQQLKKADATLAEIVASYEDIAEARRELPELEKQLADLERREREELPKIEKRVAELAELTRSFSTLQRMSNDLLTAVDSIKELERDVKEHNEIKQSTKLLDDQIEQERVRLVKVQQAWQDLDERRRTARPQLEARLQRLTFLSERIEALRQAEERYTQRIADRARADENSKQLQKVGRDLAETEQEQALVEREAQQVQQQADTLEKRWRQMSIRRQLEEWQRLKGLSQGLAQAETHVRQERQNQEKLTQAVILARSNATKYTMITIGCGIGILICLAVAFSVWAQAFALAVIAFLAVFVLFGVGIVNFLNYRKARAQENTLKSQEQDAISRVGMMVAAREAAMRMGGNSDAIVQVENEIRSLGGTIPQSAEDAQQSLEGMKDQGDLGDVQQRMKEKIDEANAARNQVNVTMEAVAGLRKERMRLEEQRKKEKWFSLEEQIREDQASVERLQQEVILLAGPEGLPLPSVNARIQASPVTSSLSSTMLSSDTNEGDTAGIPDLESLIESTVKATEHEIASLDGKLDMMNDLSAQTRTHQDILDRLFERQQIIEERNARYMQDDPEAQIERAREQQMALRSALQSLQDSLRQRVRPLGVAFGQAAIGSAENIARKQLEELYITLGNKVMLQERQQHYTEVLKNSQEALAEHYKQLAKFSNTLGSWIVPPNPFAEALVALRVRCQKELDEANEQKILDDFEILQMREGAAKAKMQLCHQEIEDDQNSIADKLKLRNRPQAQTYARADLIAIWPLLSQYRGSDRQRLENEHVSLEQELAQLEKQELDLSQKLKTEGTSLDLEKTRYLMEQQERSYQIKKHGHLWLQEVEQRLLQKVLPHTEYYMQQILPLLTGGRYHDVHLTTENEEDTTGVIQIQVWDSAANEYVSTSTLSGGAADQLSLALRLAFAIATLPGELTAAPGFVLLDEPLSSFDRDRAQALVNVVTGDVLGQHFEQIILLSHSSAFDPALFPYHLYMENSLVVESNLPIVPVLPTLSMNGKSAKGVSSTSSTPEIFAVENPVAEPATTRAASLQ
jgi:DNA repair exonuclease SbcCD ATPase subunit/membrane protein implicated in regulation of membrane protease activity